MIIDSAGIYKSAEEIAGISGRDPFAAAGDRDIYIDYVNGFTTLLGMYTVINDERHILLNPHMNSVTERIICAHELGHDVLHRTSIDRFKAYCDTGSCFRRTKMEYEANVFAAHLLIYGDELLETLAETGNVMTTAVKLNTELDLLLIKLDEMKRLGYNINVPLDVNRNFVRDLDDDSCGIGDGFSEGV